MSGGFFRGTSADQDTRFSNKQAKLLKTQKFAQGLEHLVDMTKVKMDVMKPWIATRVTELLGFEDEVLINFIFGLLEGKEVNGKEIQISLTGFMEKNTGKFMKELWALLLSAQQNSSGVPQQFLDAKEEETRKKKEEADRIADEIQKKREKESKDMDQERVRKMDGGREKRTENPLELSPWASNDHPNEKRDGERGATRERPRSRSLSKSPRSRSRSVSSDKLYQSPLSRSPATRRRYSPRRSRSPPRRGYSYYRRSRSPLHRRSPSPARRRLQSPRRRSRSPGHRRHRRTPSPGRRRGTPSPTRHRRTPPPVRRRRTPSPVRRRRTPSPVRRRRTPSPVRRRRTPSPVRRHSTPSHVHHRRSSSPGYQRSPSIESQRSPSPAQRRSPSSLRKRSSSPIHRRSPSPVRRKPGSPLHRKSLSPVLDEVPLPSRRVSSPSSRGNERSPSTSSERSPILARGRSPVQAARSPMRVRKRSKTPPEKSLSLKSSSHSPASRGSLSPHLRRSLHKRSPGASSKGKTRSISPYKNHKKQDRRYNEDKRPTSPSDSPVQRVKDRVRHGDSPSPEKSGNQRLHRDSPGIQEESNNGRQKRSENSSSLGKHRDSPQKTENKETSLIAKAVGRRLSDSRNNDQERERGKSTATGVYPESADGVKSQNIDKDSPMKKRRSEQSGTARSDDKSLQLSNSAKEDSKQRSRIMEEQAGVPNAVSDGSDDDGRGRKEKRRNKRSKRHNTDSGDESNESEAEDRKEAKRRRRAERKLRKEEKRRRREERHRKRKERHAEKHKSKRDDSSSPSDEEAHQRDADPSDSLRAKGREIHPVVEDETDSKEKKLEVELRLKALESFKAKKGSGH
ncbi:hypothetical protein MLD38_011564 [Melastoma candidum]|uniref:Uncharacterized protein n=1 Tax=Melastoma candidum TaxID=119954 RepID=A0ACB9R3J1_9MYRT|nr:hypothetical protein MLD38_011564 [Melastoma candidum]